MVYFIKAGDYIKVGYTRDGNTFKVRLSSYQTSCPYDIEIINTIEGGTNLERDIINYFLEFHKKGEWFNYSNLIINYANNPFELPKATVKKPTNNSHKIIMENMQSILNLYLNGHSLKNISSQYGITTKRLTDYIPEESRRKAKEWSYLRRSKESPKNKKVICITTGDEFISIKEASRKLNIGVPCISRVCRGERKHTHNLIFKFVEPETTKDLLNSAMDNLLNAGDNIFE